MEKVFVIIAAGGSSRRMQGKNKLLVSLQGKPVLVHSIKLFEDNPLVEKIIVCSSGENIEAFAQLLKENNFTKTIVIEGGKERQDSVYNGFKWLKDNKADENDVILVHNGANPLVKQEEINACIQAAKQFGAAVAAYPPKDTIKQVGEDLFVEKTLDRKKLWCMQTPQAMLFGIGLKAFEKALEEHFYGTDDVQLVERLGRKVKIVACSYENIKITTWEDVLTAEKIMELR